MGPDASDQPDVGAALREGRANDDRTSAASIRDVQEVAATWYDPRMSYEDRRLTVLGPFTVSFDDPGLEDWDTAPRVKLVDLPDGTVVLMTWVIVVP